MDSSSDNNLLLRVYLSSSPLEGTDAVVLNCKQRQTQTDMNEAMDQSLSCGFPFEITFFVYMHVPSRQRPVKLIRLTTLTPIYCLRLLLNLQIHPVII